VAYIFQRQSQLFDQFLLYFLSQSSPRGQKVSQPVAVCEPVMVFVELLLIHVNLTGSPLSLLAEAVIEPATPFESLA
jgi:hypothetical protein